jgi:hypothetical protein
LPTPLGLPFLLVEAVRELVAVEAPQRTALEVAVDSHAVPQLQPCGTLAQPQEFRPPGKVGVHLDLDHSSTVVTAAPTPPLLFLLLLLLGGGRRSVSSRGRHAEIEEHQQFGCLAPTDDLPGNGHGAALRGNSRNIYWPR